MAEPTNTPMPPGTPVRSLSPAPALPSLIPDASKFLPAHLRTSSGGNATAPPKRPIVLHIGDEIKYNPRTYAEFSTAFDVIRPSAAERDRPEFIRALKERRWGDFSAIFRPFWGTGGEMGRWDAELIDLLPDTVEVFASAGAGFDWADTKLLGEKGIIYCNSGLAAAEAVADFAVAMIISTFRHLPWCISAAVFSPTSSDPNTPSTSAEAFQTCHAHATAVSHNPRGHVLGLIGFGNIGQQIAAKLGHPAFGMRIAYYDVERKPTELETSLSATFHPTLTSLLAASDCVVLATPASPDGKPLITASTLAAFQRGARFVNVARGSLVDEEALADALDNGTLSAAALDVHADEPRVNARLVEMARALLVPSSTNAGSGPGPGRVMLTCHNAGGTVETHIGFEELSMRNILAVLKGGEALTPVNLGYLKKGE
ncbi:D-isomer specific 2-hydroxyacid dehydrogenase [Chaetomium sp. MPI-SDFR-AT-0129]|nr:D-isomer specific 2-hydroxyacid dehydrogenase [Chaetomium sp. MPI-SDFR-AT-0129]